MKMADSISSACIEFKGLCKKILELDYQDTARFGQADWGAFVRFVAQANGVASLEGLSRIQNTIINEGLYWFGYEKLPCASDINRMLELNQELLYYYNFIYDLENTSVGMGRCLSGI
jgi:hypothetical protein